MPKKPTLQSVDAVFSRVLDRFCRPGPLCRGCRYEREGIGHRTVYTVYHGEVALGYWDHYPIAEEGFGWGAHAIVDPDENPGASQILQDIDRELRDALDRLRGTGRWADFYRQAHDASRKLSLGERLPDLQLPTKQEWFDARFKHFVLEHFPMLQLETLKIGPAQRYKLMRGDALIVEIETLPVNDEILEVITAIEQTDDTRFATRFWVWVHKAHQIPLRPTAAGFSNEAELHEALLWVKEQMVSGWQQDGVIDEAATLGLLAVGQGLPAVNDTVPDARAVTEDVMDPQDIDPWTKIPDHSWDRLAVRMLHEGYTSAEIARKTGKDIVAKTVDNRLSQLRAIHSTEIVPYRKRGPQKLG